MGVKATAAYRVARVSEAANGDAAGTGSNLSPRCRTRRTHTVMMVIQPIPSYSGFERAHKTGSPRNWRWTRVVRANGSPIPDDWTLKTPSGSRSAASTLKSAGRTVSAGSGRCRLRGTGPRSMAELGMRARVARRRK